MNKSFTLHYSVLLKFFKPLFYIFIIPALLKFLWGRSNLLALIQLLGGLTVIAVAFLYRKNFKLLITEKEIYIKTGAIFLKSTKIPIERVTVIKLRRRITDRIFGSTLVTLNTEAGRKGKSDFSFLLSKKDAVAFEQAVFGQETSNDKHTFSFVRVAIMAATTSAALTGALICIPLIKNLTRLFGTGLDLYLFSQIEKVAPFKDYLPPAANAVTIALAVSFLIGFAVIFLRYIRFCFWGKELLKAESGIITRTRTVFPLKKLSCIITEQNQLMRLLKLCSIRAEIGGIRQQKGDSAVVSPAVTLKKREQIAAEHFPEFLPFTVSARPLRGSLYRFFVKTIIVAALFTAGLFILSYIFPDFTQFLYLLAAAGLLAAVYSMHLSVINYKKGGVGVRGKKLIAVNTVFGKLTEMVCDKELIGLIKIRRSPADIYLKSCTVTLSLRNESGIGLKVRFISYEKLKELIRE